MQCQGREDRAAAQRFSTGLDGSVEVVDENLDECILCGLCIDASPPGTVKVHKLYSGEVLGASA